MPVINCFIPMCTNSISCRCHVCLRQPPSLRSLASFTVFHITNNLSEFTLLSETLYQHYVRANRLIPDYFRHLRCTFARGPSTPSIKRYHKDCVDPSEFPWYTHTGNTVPQRMRLLLACVQTSMNGGVVCAINRYSQQQTVCSASGVHR